jgi:hypothetical protein
MTKLQHQRIQHLQFNLRSAKRVRKANGYKANEIEQAWAQHELDMAVEEVHDSPSIIPTISVEDTPEYAYV